MPGNLAFEVLRFVYFRFRFCIRTIRGTIGYFFVLIVGIRFITAPSVAVVAAAATFLSIAVTTATPGVGDVVVLAQDKPCV